MKKLLLLSAAFLIFACSSDDSSDSSNQTFLERYDGVVWEAENDNVIGRYMFTNNPKGLIQYNSSSDVLFQCKVYLFEQEAEGQDYYIIIENSNDYLSLDETNADGTLRRINFEVNENLLYQDDIQIYMNKTTLTDPCE